MSNCSRCRLLQLNSSQVGDLLTTRTGDTVPVEGAVIIGRLKKGLWSPPTKVTPSYWLKTTVPTGWSSKSRRTGTPLWARPFAAVSNKTAATRNERRIMTSPPEDLKAPCSRSLLRRTLAAQVNDQARTQLLLRTSSSKQAWWLAADYSRPLTA